MCSPECAAVKIMCLKLSNLGWCLNHNFIFPLSALLGKTWHFQFSALFSRRTVEVGFETLWSMDQLILMMLHVQNGIYKILWAFAATEAFCKRTFIPLWGWTANYEWCGFRLTMLVSLSQTLLFFYQSIMNIRQAERMSEQWRFSGELVHGKIQLSA